MYIVDARPPFDSKPTPVNPAYLLIADFDNGSREDFNPNYTNFEVFFSHEMRQQRIDYLQAKYPRSELILILRDVEICLNPTGPFPMDESLDEEAQEIAEDEADDEEGA